MSDVPVKLVNSAPVKPPKLPEGLPVGDVAVIIGYLNKDGKREEIMHVIDGGEVQIASCSHTVEEKYQKAKDSEGNLLGFEPTGECVLTLKVKFYRNPATVA